MSDGTLMTTPAESPPADQAPNAAPAPADQGAPDAAPPEDTKPEDAAPAALPEKYEFTVPDGVVIDESTVAELDAIAREFKLDQAGAQKLADLGAKQAQKFAAAQAEAIEQAANEWISGAHADPEFGGAKLQESLATARKALDTFGTPELRELLDGSKLGNHPEVIRFMVRAGKAISEDGVVNGKPKSGPVSAKDIYSASNMN